MKKLLVFVFVLSAVIGQAQLTTQYLGTPKSVINVKGWIKPDSGFVLPNLDTTTAPVYPGEVRFSNSDSTVYVGIGSAGQRWMKLKGYVPIGIGTGTVTSIGASISGALGVSGTPITGSGTLAFTWQGAGTDVVLGNGSYTPYSSLITGVTDLLYSPIGHGHIASDISDFNTAVRNLFSAGSGLSYNSSTGVFTWTGSGSGITSLNGLTGTTQTLAIDTTADAASWSSVGTAHTLRLPKRLFLFDTTKFHSESYYDTKYQPIGYIPSLQEVTDVSSSTNNNIIIKDGSGNNVTTLTNGGTNIGGIVFKAGSGQVGIYPNSFSGSRINYLPNTGNSFDTLATLYDVRVGGAANNYTETDPIWSAASSNYYTKTNLQTSGQAAVHWGNITNAPSFLTSYTETDPIYSASAAAGITSTNITSWNSKMSNPMTAAGDLIIGGASGVPTRLAAGTNGYTLTMQSGSPIWVNGNTWSGTIANSSTSAATSQTLFTGNQAYVFTGSSAAIWTLPDRAGSSNKTVWIKNQGTAPLTIQRAGTDEIFTTTNVTSETLQPGESRIYLSAGSYWQSNFISIGSGTVNSGSQYNWAYYAGAGTAVSGISVPANKIVATDANGLPTASSVDVTTFNNYFYKNEYFTNRGNLDTVMTNVNDSTIGFKSIRVTAGTGITVTPTITDSTINYQVANSITNNNQLTNGSGFITNATGLISAGTNVTITGSGTSGSPYVINASGSGGSSTFAGLTDVAITSPANNQVPTYNSGTGKWTNTNAAVMNLTSVANNDLLKYNSATGQWVNFTPSYLTSESEPAYTANGVPKTRTLTINGTTYDLSADRSWTIAGGSFTDNGYANFDATKKVLIKDTVSGNYYHTKGAVMNTTSLTDGQLLKYVSANSDWENTSLKTINGNSLFGSGDITVSGSLPSLAQNHLYVGNASSAPVDAGSNLTYDGSNFLLKATSATGNMFEVRRSDNSPAVSFRPDGGIYSPTQFSFSSTGATNQRTFEIINMGSGFGGVYFGWAGNQNLSLEINGSSTPTWRSSNNSQSFLVSNEGYDNPEASFTFNHDSRTVSKTLFLLKGEDGQTGKLLDIQKNVSGTYSSVFNVTPSQVYAKSLDANDGVTYMATLNNGVFGYQAIPSGGSMVYPSAGIPVSTGSAWGTSITDNSANWNTAYNKNTVSGSYSSGTLTLTKQDATTVTVSGFPTNNNQLTNGSGFISAANLSLGTATSTTLPITNSAGTGFTLPTFSTTAGLVPGTTSNTTNFLRADGTWAAPAGGTTYTFSNSLRNTSGTIDLQGDVTTPNPNAVYGADASGSRGWQPLRSVNTTASTTTLTPNIARMWDMEIVTAQAAAITIANPTGTISNGYELMIRIADNGTARAITWGTNYRASTNLSLPTTTTTGRTMYIKFIGNSDSGKMDLVSVLDGF